MHEDGGNAWRQERRTDSFARMIATTGVRGRVAIANLCLNQMIVDEATRNPAVFVLSEFYWEFVEQEHAKWHDRRRGFEGLDAIGSIAGRTGRMLELVDLATTEYLFSVIRTGTDRLCLDLGHAFFQVFGDRESFLAELCGISPLHSDGPGSRWPYLEAWSRAAPASRRGPRF
jgi:hypothetical protein